MVLKIYVYDKDVSKLADHYQKIYNRPLIGKDLNQFHSDFHFIFKSGEKVSAIKSIFCGKKSYLDMLTNPDGEIAFHCRMKGITMKSLELAANRLFPDDIPVCLKEYEDGSILFIPDQIGKSYSIYSLYKKLHNGEEVVFDLCEGNQQRFEMNDNFSVTTKTTFLRKIVF